MNELRTFSRVSLGSCGRAVMQAFKEDRALKQSISRTNLRSGARALIPAFYSFDAVWAWSGFPGWEQSRLLAACDILSEWHGLNPTLGTHYFSKYHEFVKLESGRETYTYGERLRLDHQLANCVTRLSANRDSRQAVAVIYMPEDTHEDHWHAPCTLTYQFTRAVEVAAGRDRLDMLVSMRSQDFARGMKYDGLQASFLCQALASQLGWDPGQVGFFVGNLHIYDADYEKLKDSDYARQESNSQWVVAHDGDPKHSDIAEEMDRLRDYEHMLRTGRVSAEKDEHQWKFASPVVQGFANQFFLAARRRRTTGSQGGSPA